MPAADILVRGAREHNLRDVDLRLPRDRLICFTGVSGSGKSSLAFDTLYAEGQRRYVQSLSSFARQFLGEMPKPDVDLISGLNPSISISQKTGGQSPRSTVGTITEIYDYLRVLYARVGKGHCPQCGRPITAQSREQIIERILAMPAGSHLSILAPLVRGQKGEYRDLFSDLLKQGFVRARVDGRIVPLSDNLRLDRQMRHDIEVVIDRLVVGEKVRTRLAEAVELALRMGDGNLIAAAEQTEDGSASCETPDARNPKAEVLAADFEAEDSDLPPSAAPHSPFSLTLSAHYACTHCNLSFLPPSPQLFSFNNPQGMCPECSGLGQIYTFDPKQLIPDPSRSFQQGCVELIGSWRDMGRWRRHIYRGVAELLERQHGIPDGTILETAWEELDPKLQRALLWGTGHEHVTFTWRSGASGYKWGGKYEGIIPKLLSQYRTTQSRLQRRQLEKYMCVLGCETCHGQRLNPQACAVTLTSRVAKFRDRPERSLPEVCGLAVSDCEEFFSDLELDGTAQIIAAEAVKEIRGRLQFLKNVGLEYLTLERTAPTLSGGEMQRIRLAGQIGCGLVGVLYVLDEPSIGLHPRDNDRLIETLGRLRDQGNTVIVVEHDEDTMRASDYVVDFGPGPGVRGGHVVAAGPVEQIIAEPKSITGQYLSGRQRIEVPAHRRPIGDAKLIVRGATQNNLKNIDVEIPLGVFVCVTGVSGSGKSSLVSDILVEALGRDLNGGLGNPGTHRAIEGLDHLDKMIAIDQSPIGRTPRSNPATYIKVFDEIRRLYAQLPDAKARGYKSGRFSFNVRGGRCEACEGNGSTRLEMDFLADVWVTCPVCEGHRFNRETLQVRFKGKSIAQVLDMDVQEALRHFENVPAIADKLQRLHDVGLDYMKLGQPSPTLSGGEAQRVKLARELVKRGTGRTLYLLDEPTTGLHFADIQLLLRVLHSFVDAGNTVLVVEHNTEVIKTADWVIDLGPEGGAAGGYLVAAGTPEDVAAKGAKKEERGEDGNGFVSHTGRVLHRVLWPQHAAKPSTAASGPCSEGKSKSIASRYSNAIRVRGARQHNLKGVDVEIPRDKLTVCCGPSGSGKTSLAIDTVYAEGQRRYVESLSAYARQFIGQMQKPRVDHIEGLSPAVAIEQKRATQTPRSTVGTVTEIYDYLRILMSRLGRPYCPACDLPIGSQSADEIIAKIMAQPHGAKLYVMAPLEIRVGERYETLWEETRASGYVRIRVDGRTYSVDELPEIDRRRKHDVEVVVDRIAVRSDARSRIAGSVENALALGRGVLRVAYPSDDLPEERWPVETHSQHFVCDQCGRSFEPLSPHHFSFNSVLGWCPACEGLGVQTGTNPATLLRDPKLTLAQGAIALWPEAAGTENAAAAKGNEGTNVAGASSLFAAMLDAFSRGTGIPLDVPFEQLGGRHRRLIFHGTDDQWFDVPQRGEGAKKRTLGTSAPSLLKFQYKGLYPALEEASRISPSFRMRLEKLVDEVECSVCYGSRLRDDAGAMRLFLGENASGRTIDELCRLPLGRLLDEFQNWKQSDRERKIAGEVSREICNRVRFLVDVGLDYLTLSRSAATLSGGEMQRIRLASQVGSGLCGVLYVLDEPTIGLHPRDNRRLLNALDKLRDLGNTLLVVEHDREVVRHADQLLDFGPAAGRHGGQVVADGTPDQVARRRGSVTGPYLSGKKAIPVPSNRRIGALEEKKKRTRGEKQNSGDALSARTFPNGCLEILGARHNNLKNIDVRIPLGTLTAVCGVSGSGKSSLVEDVLYASLARTLHRAKTTPGAHDAIRGLELINKVIRVDQQALGQTPTSNPATFTGVFDLIRTLYAQLPEAKLRGFTPRRFSFNVAGGRCEKCEGNGQLCVEMHFLPDVWVECDTCGGQRYNPETLAVRYHGQSIADVLNMSCGEAVKLFANIPKIRRPLQTLCDVGLDYLTLGQSAPTLSGGEAQRVKLAAELSRPDTGRTLYLLDEPTTGLHFDDLAKLLDVLNRLVDLGNTVLVIEHNLDVIKTADWVIDLGPEAGEGGGYVVAAGTPEEIVRTHEMRETADKETKKADKAKRRKGDKEKSKVAESPCPAVPPSPCLLTASHTAAALAPVLAAGPLIERKPFDFAAEAAEQTGDHDINELGAEVRMPWETDGRRWHTEQRVGRAGNPCRWDGRILAEVVDRIQQRDDLFAETDWTDRSVVEIRAAKKSEGWFFHAITGEEWLLKMKFRTARNTFDRDELVAKLDLKPLNDMPDLPLYGTEPRVRVKKLRGPWQEIDLRVHGYSEIDGTEFWDFVDRAVAGFAVFREKVQAKSDILQPWKQLGRAWHVAHRGFPLGKKIRWEADVLERLLALLEEAAPNANFDWSHKQVVPICLPNHRRAWAAVQTKKLDAVYLHLMAPKGSFTLGQITELGHEPELDAAAPDTDTVRLKFRSAADLGRGDLRAFLKQHAKAAK
ncbi:MAG: excinuclease ABC subunit UvrA [Planctomycetaceae bacterium]|nr:excinuclease ABC subunit UvrA [Planctomycetaceae bacterium]